MGQLSNKNQNLSPIIFNPVGGLNLAVPPHAIKDTECFQLDNFIYLPHSGQIAVRPGFSCLTPVPVAGGILNIHAFQDKLICSVSDGHVYSYDQTTETFTDIHTIDATPAVAFLNFNNLLLIADGGGLHSWDGVAAS